MADTLQFVCFWIGTQQFAMEIHRVTEVISLGEITPIPGAPPFVEGMIDLRGRLIPVIDLRKRLGVSEIHNKMQTRILIARIHRQKVGLIVDAADQVHTIPLEDIKEPPEGSRFVVAVAKHEAELLVVLDLERVFSGEEQVFLQDLKAPALRGEY